MLGILFTTLSTSLKQADNTKVIAYDSQGEFQNGALSGLVGALPWIWLD